MIDHILVYPDSAARDAAWPAPEGEPPAWTNEHRRSIMPVRMVHERAVFDAEGALVSPEVVADGTWLVIRTIARDLSLEDKAEAVVVIDAARAAAGQPYVLKNALDPETVLGQIDPYWAGAGYELPVGEPASALDAWRIA